MTPSPVPGPSVDRSAAEVIAALRDEIEGLRAAAQLRAVIEQAKGILVEREGISLDDAFSRLRRMSQEHNVRLVEVAATIVGVSLPTTVVGGLESAGPLLRGRLPQSAAASATWRALQQQPEVREGVVSALLDTVAGSATGGEESARLLFDLLEPFDVEALMMYRLTLDGSLRSIGQVGLPGDTASAWRNIPGTLDVPLTRCVIEDQPYFSGDQAQRARDFPAVASAMSVYQAVAAVPVRDAGQPIGAVGLMWSQARSFDPDTVAAVTRTVQRVGAMLVRQASSADPDLDWLNALLSLHWDPWVLLDTVAGSDGAVRDFVVTDAALLPAVRSTEWLGRRIRELWPSTASDGTAEALLSLVRLGGTWSTTVGDPGEAPWGAVGTRIRAVRIGRRVVLVWRLPQG